MANENPDDEHTLKLQEYYNTRVAYFEIWVRAWIENRMEKDKQLLTLSAFAIGLLASFFNDFTQIRDFIIWLTAILAFLCTILTILTIFDKNSDNIDLILQEHQAEEDLKPFFSKFLESQSSKSAFTTKLAVFFFVVGIVLTISLATIQSGLTLSFQ